MRLLSFDSFFFNDSWVPTSRSKDNPGAYDLGELDQALFLYLDGQDQSTTEEQTRKLNF